ncbi:hypothetical protein SAMN04487947_1921 [Halogeometricum rufum]|jgi:hypothetical protein|uniref:Uncharacterized protein n=1 Tax=Halogeometricum rufum TaxID=553469 RepID=A0A1I6H0F3_9EURY|nr:MULTISPECIES: hypothetical protein [Halogeometricum]MUV58304.1 hypothetical protein [Halogeometricum sp. CBA1124]SFR47923.1 hypothetical protein SAMN04487947_1921 [Halogeometricum rufum]
MTDTDERTMGDVSHTNPHTEETFGYSFRRGPAMADGGETQAPSDEETMGDVDHTPREGDDVNDVWTRGHGDVDE